MQGTKPPESYDVRSIQNIGFQPSNPVLSLPWMMRSTIQPEAAQILNQVPIEMLNNLPDGFFGGYHPKGKNREPKIEVRSGLSDRESREVLGHESIHALQQLYEGNINMWPTQEDASLIRSVYGLSLDDSQIGMEALPVLAQLMGFDMSQMSAYLREQMEQAGFILPSNSPMHDYGGSALFWQR